MSLRPATGPPYAGIAFLAALRRQPEFVAQQTEGDRERLMDMASGSEAVHGVWKSRQPRNPSRSGRNEGGRDSVNSSSTIRHTQ